MSVTITPQRPDKVDIKAVTGVMAKTMQKDRNTYAYGC